INAAEGDGPVNALDLALRKALVIFYPALQAVRLRDFKVRVIDSGGTASIVRVLIESTDGHNVWSTMGVSSNIIQACFLALCDSVEYFLAFVGP
ncbi:MAG: alpha-isopropylmalate synthase regulatory domain-containing protein, partial [Clostridia bacterium]